jgi:DNA polymerase III delta prime subunit
MFLNSTLSVFEHFRLSNSFFPVGFGFLCLLSPFIPQLISTFRHIFGLLEQYFYVNIEILEGDHFYHWLLFWLSEHPELFWVSANYRVKMMATSKSLTSNRRTSSFDNEELNLRNPPQLTFFPGPGYHLLWYKRNFVWLNFVSKDSSSPTYDGFGNRSSGEKIVLWKPGPSKTLLREMLLEARDYCLEKDKGKVLICKYNTHIYPSNWAVFSRREKVPFNSVILDANLAQDILNDIQTFLQPKVKEQYKAKGIPYRRTYLLYGPPGNGKTSFVRALAAELNLNICYLSLSSSSNVDDDTLHTMFIQVPENAILLIEDADVVFPSREEDESNRPTLSLGRNNDNIRLFRNKATLSGLLNAIDGLVSQEGRIVIMTTNYPERLDPAILRPGRVDRVCEFGLSSKNQAQRLFLKFHPERNDLADKFTSQFEEKRYSMAQLQAYFIHTMNDPHEAANYNRFVTFTQQQEISSKSKLQQHSQQIQSSHQQTQHSLQTQQTQQSQHSQHSPQTQQTQGHSQPQQEETASQDTLSHKKSNGEDKSVSHLQQLLNGTENATTAQQVPHTHTKHTQCCKITSKRDRD